MIWEEKLYDLITRHFGRAMAVLVGRQKTDARAYEIREIADALAEVNGAPVQASYEGGQVMIGPRLRNAADLDYAEIESIPLEDRVRLIAAERVIARESMSAANSGAAVAGAAKLLEERAAEGRMVDPSPLDSQFESTYVDITGRVYDPEVQALWSRLLADEVEQPGSFSLRTLRTLETLSSDEATLFEDVARRRFESFSDRAGSSHPAPFVLKRVVDHADSMALASVGLLAPASTRINFKASAFRFPTDPPVEWDISRTMFTGNIAVAVGPSAESGKAAVYYFTTVGAQIASLVDPIPAIGDAVRLARLFGTGDLKTAVYEEGRVVTSEDQTRIVFDHRIENLDDRSDAPPPRRHRGPGPKQ